MKNKLPKPSWFNIEKYDDISRSFTKSDWLEQLSLRYIFYILPQVEIAKKPYLDLFESIKNEVYPKSNIGVDFFKRLVCTFHESELSEEITQKQLNKRAQEISEIIVGKVENKNFDCLGESDFKFDRLIDGFQPVEKIQVLNQNQQKRWTMHRVLAYVDLVIWCKVNNYNIKNHGDITFTELTQWVFDDRDPYGISRSQLKNVKKYESEMMNMSFIIELYKYAK